MIFADQMPRAPAPLGPDVLRAAKLTRIPGVTIADACKRFGVAKSAVSRARKANDPATQLAADELVLAALTDNGATTSGTLENLQHVASWLDYVNKDGSTAKDVYRMLDAFVATGQLAISGQRWTLLRPWP